ncbi:MAG TPA: PDZ domain-containing protein, partial [Patescibacteria group bacterium]|nr:PDZ domain-containing protein [Patescibacteria group bacterium]
PYLGVAYRMVSRELSVRNQIPEGAYVETVVKDSSAEKSGVRAGDIITHFDGKRLQQNNAELSRLISAKKVGDTVAITLYRENENGEGQEIKISATLENAPDQ